MGFLAGNNAETAAGNRRSLQNLTPVSTWLYATEINSPGQSLLPETGILGTWNPWEGSKKAAAAGQAT